MEKSLLAGCIVAVVVQRLDWKKFKQNVPCSADVDWSWEVMGWNYLFEIAVSCLTRSCWTSW